MKKGGKLAGLTDAKLRAWILARMRGEKVDPPVSESRMESPEDYVRAVHGESTDKKFRARLEKAVIAALREAGSGDLKSGIDAIATRHLAALADALELREAAPVLAGIAERGAFGGHRVEIDPEAEELVLFALAGLQKPGSLWSKWLTLWKGEFPRLWPVTTAGLRLSDPKKALGILPEVVERATRDSEFPLGDVLWAYATDESYGANDVAQALGGLSLEARARCREALKEMGAEPHEIAAWVPASPASLAKTDLPSWARRCSILRPPRFEAARP